MQRVIRNGLAITLAALGLSCGVSHAQHQARSTETSAAVLPQPGDGGESTITMQMCVAFGDGDVLAIESAINAGEVMLAEIATAKATNARVRAFAAEIAGKHRDAQDRVSALAQQKKIRTSSNDTSKKIADEVASTVADLEHASGADFDKAYIASQMKLLKSAWSVVENRLLGSVADSDLEKHLATLRYLVSEDLAKARDIHGRLETEPVVIPTHDTTEPASTKPQDDCAN